MTVNAPPAGPVKLVTTTSSPTAYGSRFADPGIDAEPSWTTASTRVPASGPIEDFDHEARQTGRIGAKRLDDPAVVVALADHRDGVGRGEVGMSHRPTTRAEPMRIAGIDAPMRFGSESSMPGRG